MHSPLQKPRARSAVPITTLRIFMTAFLAKSLVRVLNMLGWMKLDLNKWNPLSDLFQFGMVASIVHYRSSLKAEWLVC